MGSSLYKSSERAGFITDFGGGAPPPNYLLCNGSPLSTTLYRALFNAIGYSYGGSGTTFYPPDTRGATLIGEGTGLYAGATNRQRGVGWYGTGTVIGRETDGIDTSTMPAHDHGNSTYEREWNNIGANGYHYHSYSHTHADTHHHNYYRFNQDAGNHDFADPRYQPPQNSTATVNQSTNLTGGSKTVTSGNPVNGSGSAQYHDHASTYSSGGGGVHNTMQPTLIVNHIIRF